MSPENEMRGRFATIAEAREFMLLGNARITLVSKGTGVRFTFRVRQPEDGKPHFVSLLHGPDNETSYQFLGTIFNRDAYRHGKRSSIGTDAPSAKAFKWFWERPDGPVPPNLEVWHEGRCGRCGRALTVPESIARGVGPECARITGRDVPSPVPAGPAPADATEAPRDADPMDMFTELIQRAEAEEEIERMNRKFGFPVGHRPESR